MAQLLTIRLTRNDSSTSWGFRLQGGKDFGTPLLIQKVNIGSLAEKAGLQVGDAVIRVNGKEVADVRHKDAQDVIVRAGNLVEFTIQRGGNVTWKPAVTPVGSVPSPNPYISTSPSPVTKTSLASSPHQSPRIPQGFNSSSKPYSPQQVNGGGGGGGYVNENGSIKAIVNKQYNTPVGIYSDESIAETLSAQAEVLAGGVLGVNFKKNEKNYNAENSEVFKMVLEAEKEPKSPEPERPSSASYFASLSHAVGGQATSSRPQTPTAALIDRPRSTTNSPIPSASAPKRSSDPDNLTCSECRQNIVGVFVRIKEKNLHVECFKCATCGTSLKNVGYYSINNKLYCDIHAKMVARQNPPAPNLEPITISPSQQGASKIISTALIANSNSASLSPQPTLAPVPFHPPRQSPTHVPSPVPQSQPFSAVNGSKSYSPSSTFSSPISAPKPGSNIGAGSRAGTSAGLSAPRRGKGVWNPQNQTPGARIPLCAQCSSQIRGPFITALGKIWCPEHFICVNKTCRRSLLDIGFVEEPSGLHCEYCFEKYLAPTCGKCSRKIKGDCLNAIGKHFHPECFVCAYCNKLFGNSPFFLEEGLPYCENDWNELFTTKCFACGFPIEAGDRWVEALNNNYHSPCFNCTTCKSNLEGQSFYAKGGRPFCKSHAR
ncbi:PDZ and LIM domain protein Zasp isoform X5 [Planococcus citri]|uniref:PDZ and LIM domain protein Zasp isoform X5 n=1 Tax=Planococcus citri TaxID=170843 RepID=UPI0031FA2234